MSGVACTVLSEAPPHVCIDRKDQVSEVLDTRFQQRQFLVHIPQTLDRHSAVPLVFVFHGAGQSSEDMRRLSGFDPIADALRFVVAYPSACATTGTWNTVSGATDFAMIRDLIDEIGSRTTIDRSKVYAVGLSNGGQFVHRVGCELSDEITAIASVAGQIIGSVSAACAPSRPVPAMFFHGTEDPILSWGGAVAAAESRLSAEATFDRWSTLDHCTDVPTVELLPDIVDDSTSVERRVRSACRDGAEVVLYAVIGGGHTWPGGSAGAAFLGRVTSDISASDVIAEFFLRFAK